MIYMYHINYLKYRNNIPAIKLNYNIYDRYSGITDTIHFKQAGFISFPVL